MSEQIPRKKATTLEGREQQNIALAVDLAEKQLSDGTASATVITHYLKLAMEERKLEQLRILQEIEVARAKVEQAKSNAHIEELYEKAIAALKEYKGISDEVDMDDPRYQIVETPDKYFYNPGGAINA